MRKSVLINLVILVIVALLFSYCGQPGTEKNEVQSENDSTGVEGDSLKKKDGTQQEEEDQKSGDEDLIPVEVTNVTCGSISDFILLSSNLETEVMADVFDGGSYLAWQFPDLPYIIGSGILPYCSKMVMFVFEVAVKSLLLKVTEPPFADQNVSCIGIADTTSTKS